MPELPEVEITRLGILPLIKGKIFKEVTVRQHRLRLPVPTDLRQRLVGQRVIAVRRRGKYLIFELPQGHLIIHLGMSGSLCRCDPQQPAGKHDHIDFDFPLGVSLRYHDPRRFGLVVWEPENPWHHPLLKDLGVEPLKAEFDGDYLYRISRQRRVAVKVLLMNSRIVVGVGNIYANEALFIAGVRPQKVAGRLSLTQCEKIQQSVKQVLQEALAAGGTTLRDFSYGDRQSGYFQLKLRVYGRDGQPCVVCRRPIEWLKLGQRSSYFCKHCQR